ncbi:unnamed protein product [Diatraea saccharalis]|uniref:Uncharacterized protein n=1 Tax=Diatraea saccharalis TaxID=40085 RepID=A0A9N9WM60_9NEOP|nr:unnamed protein product [Diatraea saccharalis]
MTSDKHFDDLLESDDELPVDYVEVPDIPAYKLDNRFKPIKFSWIDSNFSKYYKKKISQNNVKMSVLYPYLNEDMLRSKTENLGLGKKTLILNSVLPSNDIYCLKCIESSSSDSFFLWFINFLIYKDLQSDFSFLKSCLVNFPEKCDDDGNKDIMDTDIKNYNFDFVY